jgi:putative ATP-dependent endonuclease of the OLD family
MRLTQVRISNYRCFPDLSWSPTGDSAFVISGPAGGKTTLLTALALSVGRERSIARTDFTDLSSPLEINVALETTTPGEAASLAPHLDFAGAPTLRLTLRAVFDATTDEIEVTRARTDTGGPVPLRALVTGVPLLWLPAWRDPSRLLSFVGGASLVRRLLNPADMDAELNRAKDDIQAAIAELTTADPLSALASALSRELASLIPDVGADPVTVDAAVQSSEDLLRLLQVAAAYGGPPIAVTRSSTGLGQLIVLSLLLRLASAHSIVLLDEPEIALPPQAQRSFVRRLESSGAQCIIATHSPYILRRGDPRRVVRLHRDGATTHVRQTGPVTNQEAEDLARFSGTETASAFFARTAILVEGLSDQLAIETLASRLNVDLDAKAASIVACEGAGSVGSFLSLLGPTGLGLRLLGLCDADWAERWREELSARGLTVADRAEMERIGFGVSDPDLEAELVAALGTAPVEAVIATSGRSGELTRFENQPAVMARGLTPEQLLTAFVRRDKVFWAPRLAAALDLGLRSPRALFDLIDRV